MDNKKCLIFIRGFDPVLDNKYNPFKHPAFSQTADGEGIPYEHEAAAEGESREPGFTILNEKSLAYYEGLKEKGEPVYIDTVPYEDFALLGQVEMEKRFMDLDGQEQRVPLDEDMELEYAFDMEEDMQAAGENGMRNSMPAENNGMAGSPSAAEMGIPESFVIGEPETTGTSAAGNGGTAGASVAGAGRKHGTVPQNRERKPPAGREDKAADSISYRMFHWKFTVEQKEEVRRAMAVRVPKEVILSYFYPETPVARMMEIRSRYE